MYRKTGRRLIQPRLKCRRATEADCHALSRLSGPALVDSKTMTRQIRNAEASGCTLVAELAGRPVGMVVVVHSPGDSECFAGCWLFGMQVRMRWRGLGIGSRLLAEAGLAAGAESAQQLNLFVQKDTAIAIALYRKAGYRELGVPVANTGEAQQVLQDQSPLATLVGPGLGRSGSSSAST